ncbi:hypothetical protein GF361_05020 [Candidatus Woesearchaeota archaeon]|nr:hypothetical protein [Candidatus Woesearchaeota archaeon]
MAELLERIRTYLSFSKDETLTILISSIIIGFVFAFRQWNITNLVVSILIVALSFLFHITTQKIIALHYGYKVQYKIWWPGHIIPLILVFATNGRAWWLIIPGGISFSLLAGLRLGRFRYGLNYGTMGVVSLMGPVASIVLATIFKQIDVWFFAGSSVVFNSIFIFNLAYAVSQLLPIPPLDGHYLFYASRLTYIFIFGTIFTYTVFSLLFTLYSWIFALLAGGLAWLIFYITFERTAWYG